MAYSDRLYKNVLRTAKGKGAAVSFSSTTEANYDETSDTNPDDTTTVVNGFAVETMGDPEEYAALGLTVSSPVTLLFVPNTVGQIPAIGSVATWAGQARTVRSVQAIRPAGQALGARLVLS